MTDLRHAFYKEFRKVKGVGTEKAARCADAAVKVCNSLVAEVEEGGQVKEKVEDEDSSDFPWHLIPDEVQYIRFEIAELDEFFALLFAPLHDEHDESVNHICDDPKCANNLNIFDQIPNKYKHHEWEGIVIERPSPSSF